MKSTVKKLVSTFWLISCFFIISSSLQPAAAQAKAEGDYLERKELIALLDELEKEFQFNRNEIETLFSDVKRKDSIIKAMNRPAEGKPWKEYRPIFITSKRIKKGVAFWEKNLETLKRAEATFGVPAEIIVAIIGVETFYGHNKGSYRVIDALATLGFDYPKRSKFFSNELKNFVVLSREAGLDPAKVKGSYAGAMGYPQFIPTSYRHYAVDFDDDGITDLIDNPVDAIGSVGSYFKAHGWQTDGPVVFPATVNKDIYDDSVTTLGLKPSFTLTELSKKGLSFKDSNLNIDLEQKATALKYQGKKGEEFWLGLKNFYVITRYNHSALYAMAVFQLSEAIKEKMSGQQVARTVNKEVTTNK